MPLTQRESEVLRQLANGLTNKEIANTLNISYETVKEHVQHVLRKIVSPIELKRPSGQSKRLAVKQPKTIWFSDRDSADRNIAKLKGLH